MDKEIEGIGVIFGVVFTLATVLAWPYGALCAIPAVVAWLVAFKDWLPE